MSLLEIEFRNEHLSVSRLKLLEECPLSFFYRYVDKPSGVKLRGHGAASHGVVLHAALEAAYAWIVAEEYAGAFPLDVCVAAYRQAWEEADLIGVSTYQEGLDMIRSYATSHPLVDHLEILDVEREFNISLDGFTMNGYIDRVDKRSDEAIAIIDYKSNRRLFVKEQLQNDLQMSVYGLAARELYPWARRVTFEWHMIRFDVVQGSERTSRQIEDARGHVVALGRRSEETKREWPARLNENCGYCEHRGRCDVYKGAVGGEMVVRQAFDMSDIESISAERERVANLAKAAYARKEQLDSIIKKKLAAEGEFCTSERAYKFQNAFETVYDPIRTVDAFVEAGLDRSLVESKILLADKSAVEELRTELVTDPNAQRGQLMFLKAQLDAIAVKRPMSPKLDSRAVKKIGTV